MYRDASEGACEHNAGHRLPAWARRRGGPCRVRIAWPWCGVHGGLHNEAATAFHSSDWSRVIARRNEIRMYGAFVLLVTLSASALSTLALTLSGIFPIRRAGILPIPLLIYVLCWLGETGQLSEKYS